MVLPMWGPYRLLYALRVGLALWRLGGVFNLCFVVQTPAVHAKWLHDVGADAIECCFSTTSLKNCALNSWSTLQLIWSPSCQF